MKGRPAYRKRLLTEHTFAPDDAECCTWKSADGRVCGLPETNRHHTTIANRESQPAQPEETQLRLDIDG